MTPCSNDKPLTRRLTERSVIPCLRPWQCPRLPAFLLAPAPRSRASCSSRHRIAWNRCHPSALIRHCLPLSTLYRRPMYPSLSSRRRRRSATASAATGLWERSRGL